MVKRMQVGDEAAARALFNRYANELRRRVRKNMPPVLRRKVAESDVLQEAYLAAFRDLWRFEARDDLAFRRWLARILEHRIQDEIRRFGAQKRDAKREIGLLEPPVNRDPSPSRVLMAAEERAAVWRAIEELPPDQQRVIRLVHEEGLRIVDAAERLDRSADAARKLYGRALSRLSRQLLSGKADGGAPAAS